MTSKNTTIIILLGIFHFVFSSYTLLPLSEIEKKGVSISSKPGAYKAASLELKLDAPQEYKIYYSLNGNYPADSTGRVAGPILLNQTSSLSVRLVNDRFSENDTIYIGTYLLNFSSTLPIVSLTLPPSFLYDPESGIYVGKLSESMERIGPCWLDIEKLVFFEYINNNTLVLNHAAGIKTFGGLTRQNPEKSLRLIARKKYGPGKFKYPFFKTKNISEFNSIILRTSGNDYNGTRFLDMMCASLAKDIGVDYLAYQPSVLFVNGKYWGIHNIREKTNEDYLKSNHGVDISKTDLLFGSGSVQIGSSTRYKSAINYLENHTIDSPYFADSIESYFDIDNYFKYISLQIFIVNLDSRGNVRCWQSNTTKGRFKWIFYDADLSFYKPQLNYLKNRLSPRETVWYNPTWSTIILRKLTEVPAFKEKFINTYCFLNSTILSQDSIASRINYFKSYLNPEIDRHVKRKGYHYTREYWESNVNKLFAFSRERALTSLLHMQEHYGLVGKYNLKIPVFSNNDKVSLKIDVHTIPSYPYSGNYFSEIPLTLSVAFVHPAYKFIKWSDDVRERSRRIYMPKDSILSISPVIAPASASSLKDKIKITAIGTGTGNDKPIIILTKKSFESNQTVLYVLNEKSDTLAVINTSGKSEGLFLCAESGDEFLKAYQIPTTNFFLSNKTALLSESKGIYITDAEGNMVDSLIISSANAGAIAPYYLRKGEIIKSYVSRPSLDEINEKWYNTIFTKIIAASLLLIVIIALIIRYRK